MNILYYFLIALIAIISIISITDSSHTALMSAKFDVDKSLAFWTPERINSAKPLIFENIEFRNKTTSGTKNVKIINDDQQLVEIGPGLGQTGSPAGDPASRVMKITTRVEKNECNYNGPSFMKKVFCHSQRKVNHEIEIDNYLNEMITPTQPEGIDVYQWWNNNRNSFPILSRIARKYLSIPATSVPCMQGI